MKFTKSKILAALILIFAVIGLALPAPAQVVPTRTLAFSNAPTRINDASVSNATVNAYTYLSNMIPVSFGKGLALGCRFNQTTNGQAAAITHYFGLVYVRTNTSTVTNFSWTITPIVNTNLQSVWTNIPAAVLDNADGVFWWSTQNANTNTLLGFQLLGQKAN